MLRNILVGMMALALVALVADDLLAQGRGGRGGFGRPGAGQRQRNQAERQENAEEQRLAREFGEREDADDERPLYSGAEFTDAQVRSGTHKFVRDADTDRDGKLSEHEFEGVETAKIFDFLDRNNDGFLDEDELRIYMREKMTYHAEHFASERFDYAYLMPYPGPYLDASVDLKEHGVRALDTLYPEYRAAGNSPEAFVQEAASRLNGNGGPMLILVELILWFVVILASVLLVMAVRRVPVQYARRTASGGYEKNIMGSRQYIPLKLNASGVMPIIFAQAIMFAPGLLGRTFNSTAVGQWMLVYGI